ncbi:MAG: hypothetical protein ACLPXT_07530 [Terracidiphilus sp.]
MPNGLSNDSRYQEVIAGYEAFFSPINELFVDFAKNNNLVIQKYYHDAPCWSLCFSHPSGGVARIDLERKSESKLGISGIWWVDDYDSFTRSIKNTNIVECEPTPLAVEPHLKATLKSVLSLTPGDWSQVITGCDRFWRKTWTKKQFEKLNDHLPFPKLD